jgi:hypothetical protein
VQRGSRETGLLQRQLNVVGNAARIYASQSWRDLRGAHFAMFSVESDGLRVVFVGERRAVGAADMRVCRDHSGPFMARLVIAGTIPPTMYAQGMA